MFIIAFPTWLNLMQRTSLVCFKMQRKMQRSLHFISFLIHTSPLGEVGSRSLHLYGENGSPPHEGPLRWTRKLRKWRLRCILHKLWSPCFRLIYCCTCQDVLRVVHPRVDTYTSGCDQCRTTLTKNYDKGRTVSLHQVPSQCTRT